MNNLLCHGLVVLRRPQQAHANAIMVARCVILVLALTAGYAAAFSQGGAARRSARLTKWGAPMTAVPPPWAGRVRPLLAAASSTGGQGFGAPRSAAGSGKKKKAPSKGGKQKHFIDPSIGRALAADGKPYDWDVDDDFVDPNDGGATEADGKPYSSPPPRTRPRP